MCFSLRASILKPDPINVVPDIKSICFANHHDFPLERVPSQGSSKRFPWAGMPLRLCQTHIRAAIVFSSSANTVLFCPTGRADKISSDTIIWSVFNKKLERLTGPVENALSGERGTDLPVFSRREIRARERSKNQLDGFQHRVWDPAKETRLLALMQRAPAGRCALNGGPRTERGGSGFPHKCVVIQKKAI